MVKNQLREAGVEFSEMGMDTAEGITELRVNGCFAMEAPVVKRGDKFFEDDDLFDKDGDVIKFWEDDESWIKFREDDDP